MFSGPALLNGTGLVGVMSPLDLCVVVCVGGHVCWLISWVVVFWILCVVCARAHAHGGQLSFTAAC